MKLALIAALCGAALLFALLPMPPAQQVDNVILFTVDGVRWQEVFAGADEALLTEEAGGVGDVDSLREEFWRTTAEQRRRALMPFLWDVIVPSGQLFGNVRRGSEVRVTNGHNFSYPGYHEMLGGFPDPRIDSNAKILNPNPNVLEWIARQPGFEGRVAAFTAWDVFPYILNEPRAGITVNAGWEPLDDVPLTPRQELINQLMRNSLHQSEGARSDELTFFAAMEYLQKARPRVLFISLDGADVAAHSRRYDNYLRSARLGDELLRLLWEKLQSMEQYAGTTTLIVTTDHGRGDPPDDWRSHGAEVIGSELMWLAATGPSVAALGERFDTATLTQSQIAATVAALLGLDYRAAVPAAAPPIAQIIGQRP